MTHGSLFTGIGGFDLGLEWAGIQTIWQVEIDEWETDHYTSGYVGHAEGGRC